MGNVLYLSKKIAKKYQVASVVPVFRGQLYFEDPVLDLDFVNFLTHVASQMPQKSKKEFMNFFERLQDFSQLVIKDGTPEMKQAMIDMGFLITNGDKDEPRK